MMSVCHCITVQDMLMEVNYKPMLFILTGIFNFYGTYMCSLEDTNISSLLMKNAIFC